MKLGKPVWQRAPIDFWDTLLDTPIPKNNSSFGVAGAPQRGGGFVFFPAPLDLVSRSAETSNLRPISLKIGPKSFPNRCPNIKKHIAYTALLPVLRD